MYLIDQIISLVIGKKNRIITLDGHIISIVQQSISPRVGSNFQIEMSIWYEIQRR